MSIMHDGMMDENQNIISLQFPGRFLYEFGCSVASRTHITTNSVLSKERWKRTINDLIYETYHIMGYTPRIR